MPRNSSGGYVLPAGNPVITRTTISSTWANTTTNDLGVEVANSLDRNGRGPMIAPLALAVGTAGAPALTFAAETSSGLFRGALNDLRMQVGGNLIENWLATGVAMPLGLTLTQSQANTTALSVTGTGTAAGAVFTGGSTNGSGIAATGGGTSGAGVTAVGASTNGPGGVFTGGAVTGTGLTSTGGMPTSGNIAGGLGAVVTGGVSSGTAAGGVGATLTGGAPGGAGNGGVGAIIANGLAATSTVQQDALTISNGSIRLDGVANPIATVAFKNRVTPSNIPKAWGVVSFISGAISLLDGFNVSSVAFSGNFISVTLASSFISGGWLCPIISGDILAVWNIVSGDLQANPFRMAAVTPSSGTQLNLSGLIGHVWFSVFYRQ